MTPPSPPLLVYDGDCELCARWSARLVRWAGLPADTRASHHDLDGDLRARVEAAGLRNELKTVDRTTGAIAGGVGALLDLCRGTRLAIPAALGRLPPLRAALGFGYAAVARNRRILAPTPSGAVCACDPDPHLGWNLAFAATAGAVAALGWWLLIAVGGGVLGDAPVGWGRAAWKVPFPLLALFGCLAIPRGRRLAWASHLLLCHARAGVVFAVGSLAALVARRRGLGGGPTIALYAAGALVGSVVFLRQIRRHARAMSALATAEGAGAAPPASPRALPPDAPPP